MRKIALLAFVAVAAACGSSSDGTTPVQTVGYVRVANLAFGTSTIDFCYAPQGTTNFTGPVHKNAGDAIGIPNSLVSKYWSLPTGSYTLRLVAFGATSCGTALAGFADLTAPVGTNIYYTAAAVGATGAYQQRYYTDVHTADATKVTLRIINTIPGSPTVDIGTGAPASFVPLFTNLAYLGIASPTTIVNAQGYAVVSPAGFTPPIILTTCLSGQVPSALTCPSSVTLTPEQSAGIAGGVVASVFSNLTALGAPQMVLCGDSTAPLAVAPNLTPCVIGAAN